MSHKTAAGLRKYLWVGITSVRSNLAYLSEVAARTIFLAVILYIFLRLWQVTYAGAGAARLGGFTLPEMLWYLSMTEAISLSGGGARAGSEVDQDVRTGALAVYLVRPLSYPLYRLWSSLGERLVRFVLNALVGAAIALLLVGPIRFTPAGLVLFAVSAPLAFLLDWVTGFCIGLGAFWLEDTGGIGLIYSRLTMILGGMMIPLELFPAALQRVLRVLPFASIVYGPSRLFVRPDSGFFRLLLERQGIAILLISSAAAVLYGAALRRVHGNGG